MLPARQRLRALVAALGPRFQRLMRIYDEKPSLLDRTVGTGITRQADSSIASAPAAMSAAPRGRGQDARRNPGYPPYDDLDFEVPVLPEGDVNARVWIRAEEVEASLGLIEQILDGLPAGPIAVELPRRRRRGPGAGRGLPRGDPDLGPARCRRPHRALPSARSLLVPVAAAGGGDRRQHRRRLPLVQQILQLLLLGARTCEQMWNLIARTLLHRPVTEPAPRPPRRWPSSPPGIEGAPDALGRSLSIRAGRCRLLQRLRARDPCAEQPLSTTSSASACASSPPRATPMCCW